MAPPLPALTAVAIPYLERQGWYQTATLHAPAGRLSLVACDLLRDGPPGLARLILGRGERRFQLLVGWRQATEVAAVLKGKENALLGPVADGGEHVLAYDALADDELILELLEVVTGGAERAERVRRVSTLVSHAALVFDERLFMKCYRVLEAGERPEAEVLFRLHALGFAALLAPVARWQGHGFDLALVRQFLPSALEGRLLALTSLRDLLAYASGNDESSELVPYGSEERRDPEVETAAAGGDLSAEMRRLGAMTAGLHLALAAAFGRRAGEGRALGELLSWALAEGQPVEGDLARLVEAVVAIPPGEAGAVIRLHGDYHLRRVMRAESGWIVAGFSDDPLYATARPHASLPPRVGSPVEDLADMCFSLRRVAREALAMRPGQEVELARGLADAWERRNRAAFLEGYSSTPGARELLPREESATGLLLQAFERVRERRYEAMPAE